MAELGAHITTYIDTYLNAYIHAFLGEHWVLVFAGLCAAFFIAAFVDSIAGGGGFISTPSLLLAGIPPHLALGTNKCAVIFGTAVASANFIAHGKILWRIVAVGVVCASVGAYIGSLVVVATGESVLKSVILILLPLSALIALIPRRFHAGRIDFSRKEIFLTTPLLTLSIGFYDGYFGPGTGSFLIFGFYIVLGMDLLYASGSAKLINLGSGLGSLIAFMLNGSVLYLLAFPLIICNMLGGYLGSKLALKRGVGFVRAMVIAVFVMMFVSLIVRYRADLYATMLALYQRF